ncbi:MAG: alpha/beta hydrolase [Nonlabens sp.]
MIHLNHDLSQTDLPCILFLHGFLGNMDQWDKVQHKTTHIPSFKIELPGHGHSDDCVKSYSINELADQVEILIHSYNLSNIHLMGHSMGGYVAANIAHKIPERMLSLTLINSIAGGDSPDRIKSRDRSLKLIAKFRNAFVNMAIANLFSEDERTEFYDEIEAMKKQAVNISSESVIHAILAMRNRESSLEKLKLKQLELAYIYSTTDPIVPKEKVLKEIQLLHAKGYEIESGHMSILTHPEKISSILNSIVLSH